MRKYSLGGGNPMLDMSLDLRIFWKRYGLHGHCTATSHATKRAVIAALVEMASTRYVFKHRETLHKRRKKFNRRSTARRGRMETCFACGADSDVRHHIIPLSNGGTNSKKNLVGLCNECHAEIHPWLKESLPEQSGRAGQVATQTI